MSLCEHFLPGPLPYDNVLVLDDHLGPTEALIRCSSCRRAYLLELLDWEGAKRLFRIAAPDEEATRLLLKDLDRGSCDLRRAGEEVRQFSLTSERLPHLLLVDVNDHALERTVHLENTAEVPTTGWRALPCDGAWIERVQSARL